MNRDAVGANAGHPRVRPHLDADPTERGLRPRRQHRPEWWQHTIGSFDQKNAGPCGVDLPKVMPERPPREFADRAGHFHARRPGADDHEGEQRPRAGRVVAALGVFE